LLIKESFLICLAGLPASGKTTFAQKLKEKIEKKDHNFKVIIIDPDKIRDKISPDKFDYKKEKIIRENNLEAIKRALKEKNIVISDDLNYYSSMRHDLKKIAEKLGLKYFIIHIATPLEICLKWNKIRGKPIPNRVIKKVYNKFDNFDRYSWDYPIVEYDPTQTQNFNGKTEEYFDRIFNKLINEINTTKKIEKLKIYSNIDNEKLDTITRKIVGDLLRNPIYKSLKNKIIVYRKLFIKDFLNTSFNELEISKAFKEYLEKSLNIKIA
jgi:tRNA uridine 5-carbamoylmethylation protein Kti12